jgi:hypothetical protein
MPCSLNDIAPTQCLQYGIEFVNIVRRRGRRPTEAVGCNSVAYRAIHAIEEVQRVPTGCVEGVIAGA